MQIKIVAILRKENLLEGLKESLQLEEGKISQKPSEKSQRMKEKRKFWENLINFVLR